MLHVGILGAGRIAGTMAKTLGGMEEACAWAVAARDKGRAETFARAYGVERAYGSYAEMLADPQVDLVYIATPHSHHLEHGLLCLDHGKPVLCEKAFTANAAQARQLIARAEERKIFLTEAMWTRYMPSRKIIDAIVASGELGTITGLTANLCYPMTHKERLVRPELAGGALLDVGIYPLNFASMVLGDDVEEMTSVCVKHPTGVDGQETIVLRYPGGVLATLHAGMYGPSEQYGIVYGTKGYLIAYNINNIDRLAVFDEDRHLVREMQVPKQITGYEYEVLACKHALEIGALECADMPHRETVLMMERMDALRAQWGVRYPFEEP